MYIATVKGPRREEFHILLEKKLARKETGITSKPGLTAQCTFYPWAVEQGQGHFLQVM